MSEEIIIINDEPFYRIQNGTSYDYAPIPKAFKPYFEKLQQENQQLKEQLENASKNYTKYIQERDNVLDEIREYINECCFIENGEKVVFQEDIEEILDKVKE